MGDDASQADPVEISLTVDGTKHTLPYVAGETVLETARRSGVRTPFQCEQGECATCMALVVRGEVRMKRNSVLDEDDLRDGYVLTCQGVPVRVDCELLFED